MAFFGAAVGTGAISCGKMLACAGTLAGHQFDECAETKYGGDGKPGHAQEFLATYFFTHKRIDLLMHIFCLFFNF